MFLWGETIANLVEKSRKKSGSKGDLDRVARVLPRLTTECHIVAIEGLPLPRLSGDEATLRDEGLAPHSAPAHIGEARAVDGAHAVPNQVAADTAQAVKGGNAGARIGSGKLIVRRRQQRKGIRRASVEDEVQLIVGDSCRSRCKQGR